MKGFVYCRPGKQPDQRELLFANLIDAIKNAACRAERDCGRISEWCFRIPGFSAVR